MFEDVNTSYLFLPLYNKMVTESQELAKVFKY